MKLLIIGASRGIGKVLLEEGLNEGHEVTVLARNPEAITTSHPSLKVIKGDVLDAASVSEALKDQEVVCSCIGTGITFKPVHLFSNGAKNIVDAVQLNDTGKYIAVTGIGAGDSKGHGGFLYDSIFKPLLLKTIYEDKDREEQLIRESDVNWLIVRPAGLTNGPRTGRYRTLVDLTGITAKRISRRDVADFILKSLNGKEHSKQAVLLTY